MEKLESVIIDMVAERFKIEKEKVQPTSTFQDLEIDSLAVVEFGLRLQETFDVAVEEDDFTADMDIRAVADVLSAKGAVAA
ncbi:acyl carrier protein [Streptomyces daliensis]|uniref:Acyl carrier protein n=1 Tax=Streptomyces daliensis TaxID=299421 RepID=A0A8T4INR5_9ACTN|nr:acyl carrier protein [Streptomyces daliensis]